MFVAVDSCFSLFIKRKKEKKILSPPCLKRSVREGLDTAPAPRGAAVAWQLFPAPLEHPTVEKKPLAFHQAGAEPVGSKVGGSRGKLQLPPKLGIL